MDNKLKLRIVERFSNSQNALVLQQSDLSLQSLSDMVTSGAIDISPKYQRRERWDNVKESELIESFLLNIPVPPIYLAEDEYGTYSVIDGKQRVTAINRFLRNELKLGKLKKFTDLEGLTFESLPSALANALKIRPYLRVVTLLRQSDSDLKYEVFLRLNKAGVALNSQEIRNVAFRGRLNDLLIALSSETYFSAQLKAAKSSKIYREMIDVQYVLRFLTVREYWKEFPGNMDKAMDAYMLVHYRDSAAQVKTAKELFVESLNFCESVWGDRGFTNPKSNNRVLQGFYDVQMVCFSLLSAPEKSRALKKPIAIRKALIDLLKSDDVFAQSITQFTSNPRNVSYRIGTFLSKLKAL